MDIEIYNGYKKMIENLIDNGHLPKTIDVEEYIENFARHYGTMITEDCDTWVDELGPIKEEVA